MKPVDVVLAALAAPLALALPTELAERQAAQPRVLSAFSVKLPPSNTDLF